LKFSERKGYKEVRRAIQKDEMSDELRNSLWNLLDVHVWQVEGFLWKQYGKPGIDNFSASLWFSYFKQPIDARPDRESGVLQEIRKYFFAAPWFEVYDFLEWTLNELHNTRLNNTVNAILERELAGFRFVGRVFTDVTGEAEIAALEEALNDREFPGVRGHLAAALRLMSDRKAPDYRNSIKESILAVESMAQSMSGKAKATLGDALAVLESRSALHSALRQGFSSLYGYTSDEGGIRHAMLEEPELGASEAKFFLLSCTSFINYLKSKA